MRKVLLATLFMLSLCAPQAWAAVPSSGTLSPSNPQLDYDGGPYTGSNPSNQIDDPNCDLVPNTCDDYALTIDIDGAWQAAHPTAIVAFGRTVNASLKAARLRSL